MSTIRYIAHYIPTAGAPPKILRNDPLVFAAGLAQWVVVFLALTVLIG